MGTSYFDKETKTPKQAIINDALSRVAYNVVRSRWVVSPKVGRTILVELDDIGAKKVRDAFEGSFQAEADYKNVIIVGAYASKHGRWPVYRLGYNCVESAEVHGVSW